MPLLLPADPVLVSPCHCDIKQLLWQVHPMPMAPYRKQANSEVFCHSFWRAQSRHTLLYSMLHAIFKFLQSFGGIFLGMSRAQKVGLKSVRFRQNTVLNHVIMNGFQ